MRAAPDIDPPAGVRVPQLRAVKMAAFATENLAAQWRSSASSGLLATAGHFFLYQVEGGLVYDGRMRILHIELPQLPVILLGFFVKEVRGVDFLQQGITLVLFVPQDADCCGNRPVAVFTPWCRDAVLLEDAADLTHRTSL